MNNKFTIVYKTYDDDLVWLKYSLLSVNKFVFDIAEIIIYYHDSCEEKLLEILSENNFNISYRIIPIKYDFHGYLKQMVVKSMCFNDVKTEYVVFVDSDVIFIKSYTPEFGLKNNKIIWKVQIKDKKNKFNNYWITWGESVRKITEENMNIYYMANGFPFILKTETLKKAYEKFIQIHGKDYNSYCKEELIKNSIKIEDETKKVFHVLSKIFEEFEYFGWYANNFSNDYIFVNIKNYKKNLSVVLNKYTIQYWSHGNLSQEIENEIKKILKGRVFLIKQKYFLKEIIYLIRIVYIGKIGLLLKIKLPKIYTLLKPYFPDKN